MISLVGVVLNHYSSFLALVPDNPFNRPIKPFHFIRPRSQHQVNRNAGGQWAPTIGIVRLELCAAKRRVFNKDAFVFVSIAVLSKEIQLRGARHAQIKAQSISDVNIFYYISKGVQGPCTGA